MVNSKLLLVGENTDVIRNTYVVPLKTLKTLFLEIVIDESDYYICIFYIMFSVWRLLFRLGNRSTLKVST